jgi:predicted hotdog family 3-hydroxylacyl-ACP dehydratase
MNPTPATLDRAGIAARIPHGGAMCLLDAVLAWSDAGIHCSIVNHADARHPLRSASGLLSPCAIEYAAQAMAVHAALCAASDAKPPSGFLASARAVRLWAARLDDAPGPLELHAQRLGGVGTQAQYGFELKDAANRLLVDGRLVVVLAQSLLVEIGES